MSADPSRNYDYIAETGEVRVRGGDQTTSFEEWETRRASAHGANRLATMLENEEVPDNNLSPGTTSNDLTEFECSLARPQPSESDFIRALTTSPLGTYEVRYDQNGELLSEPEPSYQAVVDSIPPSIEVTVHFPEKHYPAVLPVLCEKISMRRQ